MTGARAAKTPAAIAVIAVLAAGCMWGSIGLFVRYLDGLGYSPLTVVFSRMSLAAALLGGFLLLTGDRRLFCVRRRDVWVMVAAGVSSAVLLNLFYSISIVMNALSLASILLATAPIFVVALSAPLFRERVTTQKVVAMIVVFGGSVLTSGIVGSGAAGAPGGGGFSPFGVLVGLLGALGWAMLGVMSRVALNRGYHALTINFYTFFFGALGCAPFADFTLIGATVAAAPLKMSGFLLAHALVSALLPYILYTYGMRFMETGTAAILASVDPVFAAALGFFIYGERPDTVMLTGMAMVLAGLAALNLPKNPKREKSIG
ncbi:MAG: DMT family transporter [Gracilibacteraceae bacterium]|nr:DMT family transporter [Gracilibacteraceae bacterium]